jgi:hypothetical protein
MQADDLDWVLRGLEKRLAGRPDDEPLALTVGEVRAILRKVYEALRAAEAARGTAESALGHHDS